MDRRDDNLNPAASEFEDAVVRRRLQQAVHSESAPAGLRRRVRADLDRRDSGRRTALLGIAAAAAVLISGWATSLHLTGFPPHEFIRHEIHIASLARSLDPLLAAGLGDHIHCAFYRSFPERRPSPALVLQELGEGWAASKGRSSTEAASITAGSSRNPRSARWSLSCPETPTTSTSSGNPERRAMLLRWEATPPMTELGRGFDGLTGTNGGGWIKMGNRGGFRRSRRRDRRETASSNPMSQHPASASRARCRKTRTPARRRAPSFDFGRSDAKRFF